MQHTWKSLPRRLAQAVTLITLLVLIRGMSLAQSLAFSPSLTSLVAGDPVTPSPLTPSPATYVGPASGLVPGSNYLYAAVTDKYNNVYVSEFSGNIVRVIASGQGPIPVLPSVTSPQAGYVYTIAGTGVTGTTTNALSSSCSPSTGATDAFGDGCLATQAIFATAGTTGTAADGAAGLALDASGNLYIADYSADLIRVVYAGGSNNPVARLISLENTSISSPTQGFIYSIAGTAGATTDTGNGTLATTATIGKPTAVAIDPSGNVFFIDGTTGKNALLAISVSGGLPGVTGTPTNGYIYQIVGNTGTAGNGSLASTAKLTLARGLAIDSFGNIYVTDNGTIRVIYSGSPGSSVPGLSGLTAEYIYAVAGGGSTKPSFFTSVAATNAQITPTIITVDAGGNLYIGDTTNKAVYKIDLSGNLTVIAGSPTDTSGFTCASPVDAVDDGCASDSVAASGTVSHFAPEYGMALDTQGNLYVADNTRLLHELNVTASSLYFTPGQTQPVIIYNTASPDATGTHDLKLTGFTASAPFTVVPISGSLPTGITADCITLTTLQPGESCETSIEFPSSNTSAATGTLTVTSNSTNATNGTNVIQLTGESSTLLATNLFQDTAPPNSIPAGTQESFEYDLACAAGNCVGLSSFPTGTLTLYSNGTALTSVTPLTVSNSSSQPVTYTFSGVTLPTGNNFVYAVYSGDANYQSSQSTQALITVNGAATTTALAASPTTAAIGSPVTLTATVTPTAASGTVTFKSGSTVLGTGTLGANGVPGQATLSTSALPAGADSITAIYGGDDSYDGSTSPAVQVNVGAVLPSTSTALTASASTLYVTQPVTFTATVTVYPSGTPNGNVSFMSGSTLLGIGQLDVNGVATLTTSTLPAGSYNVTAVYQGNSSFASSTSLPLQVTVVAQLAPSATTLALSSTAVAEGQNVTFTATVGPSSPITPSGNVSFMDGNTTLGQGTLYGGTATFSSTALAPGNYSVTAVYGGDGNFAGSNSTAVALAVAVPTPSFTLSSTPTNLTLTSGQSGAAIITLVPTYGYTGTVTLSCGTLPTNVTCSFSPATLAADGKNDAVQSTLTISTSGATTTTASSARADRPGQNGAIPSGTARLAAFFFLPSGLLLWGFAARKKQLNRYLSLVTLALLTVGLVGVSGCGGGNGGSAKNAATGASTITITGTGSAGSQMQTVNLAITIQ